MSRTGLVDTEGRPVLDPRRVRAFVIQRDGGVCQICKVAPATEADHIWPKRLGGDDHVSNRQAACSPCNKAKGAKADLRGAAPQDLANAIAAHHVAIMGRLQELVDASSAAMNTDVIAGFKIRDDTVDRLRRLSALCASVADSFADEKPSTLAVLNTFFGGVPFAEEVQA